MNVHETAHYEGVNGTALLDEWFGYSDEEYEDDIDWEHQFYYENLQEEDEEIEEQVEDDFKEDQFWRKRSIDNLLQKNPLVQSREIEREQGKSDEEEEEKKKECFICLEELEDEGKVVTVQGCRHKYCRECLAGYIAFKSNDASCLNHPITLLTKESKLILRVEMINTYGIPCPALGCRHVMLINELVPVANSATISQFLKFAEIHRRQLEELKEMESEKAKIMRNTLRSNSKVCSICGESYIGKVYKFRRGDGSYTCSHPYTCPKCNFPHPQTMSCWSYYENFRDESDIVNGAQTHCPRCHIPIERYGGCNHMTCRCGCYFCLLCNETIGPLHQDLDGPFGTSCNGLERKKLAVTRKVLPRREIRHDRVRTNKGKRI